MVNPSIDWAKVLVHPLGLTGYALFSLFSLLGAVKRRDERKWILPAALGAAAVVLLGGLILAYRDIDSHPQPPAAIASPTPPLPGQQQNNHPQQSTTGSNSPNVQATQGDVSISYGADTQKQASKQHKGQGLTKTGEGHAK